MTIAARDYERALSAAISKSYLARFPASARDALLARSTRIEVPGASRSIVKATIELGHSLELSVIAEGVEDGAQLRALHEFGCDRAQGYRISRPLSAEDVPGLARSRIEQVLRLDRTARSRAFGPFALRPLPRPRSLPRDERSAVDDETLRRGDRRRLAQRLAGGPIDGVDHNRAPV